MHPDAPDPIRAEELKTSVNKTVSEETERLRRERSAISWQGRRGEKKVIEQRQREMKADRRVVSGDQQHEQGDREAKGSQEMQRVSVFKRCLVTPTCRELEARETERESETQTQTQTQTARAKTEDRERGGLGERTGRGRKGERMGRGRKGERTETEGDRERGRGEGEEEGGRGRERHARSSRVFVPLSLFSWPL
eukprot:1454244-Rhodomonas_salina.3